MSLSPARVAADLLRVLPRKRMSRALGRVADVKASTAVLERVIAAYVRAYDVDVSEAIVPEGGFTSFDQFFTRALRPGARSIDPDPRVLVSPADGRVEDAGRLDAYSSFLVKGRAYSAEELLGGRDLAEKFAGGTFAIVYLSPRDYHRVHAPVAGAVRLARHIGGTLFPVNAIGLEHIPGLFARNERVVVVQEAGGESVATVMVGAVGVGRITLAFEPSLVTNRDTIPKTIKYADGGPSLARGGELGTFHLGSTAIVFAQAQAQAVCEVPSGARVRVGEPLLRRGTTP